MFSVIFLLGICSFAMGSPFDHKHRPNLDLIRIVGGRNANIVDYPYQVSMLINGPPIASVQSKSRVSRITVRAGSSYRSRGGQIFNVTKLNIHPRSNYNTLDSDVAVLELDSLLIFKTGVQPIPLPDASNTFYDGEMSVVTGWGSTSYNGTAASVLQVVGIPLITTITCQLRYYGNNITSTMFCAGTAGKGTCTGDSGGPLVFDGAQLGIVSGGGTCGTAEAPGVYTDVTKFLSYINNIIA